MKKKYLKIAALVVALAMIVGLCLFANALVGNPLSKALASRAAKARLAEYFSGTDYVLDEVNYSFKDGNYYAHFSSPTSVDGDFSMAFTGSGKLRWDSYEHRVLSGENTRDRLSKEYSTLVESALEGPSSPLPLDFGFGDLEIWHREFLGNDDCPDYALVMEDLIPNGTYDVRALGAQAGHLVYYLEVTDPSAESLARWLLEIRRLMDESGVPFVDIDLSLRYPRNEDGTRTDCDVYVLSFPYEDIYEEDLVQRAEEANRAAIAYYAELDAQKK